MPGGRSNFLLLMVDQMRHDQVGWASGGHFVTPNLDRLAAGGCTFDAAYSASTTCVPSRVALLTGVHPHRPPTQQNHAALREGFWTLARALAAQGYETAAIGKMHFAPVHADHGFEVLRLCEHLSGQGLDMTTEAARADHTDDYHDWLVEHGYEDRREAPFPYGPDVHPTGWVTRETIEFLERRDPTRPLFLVVSFPHPHSPHNPPEPYASMFDPRESRLPASGFEVNESIPELFRRHMAEFGGRRNALVDPDRPAALRSFLATVRGLVRHIDDAVGEVLARCDLSETLVWFTPDHGDYGGNRGLRGKQPWLPFEDLARVPMCVAGLDVVPGRRTAALVQTFDFVRTCLDYAGLEPPRGLGMDSRNLRPLLRGGQEDLLRAVFCGSLGFNMVRRGDRKVMRWEGWNSQMLFDLSEDPLESTDRSTDPRYAHDLAELLAAMREHIDRPVLSLDAAPV